MTVCDTCHLPTDGRTATGVPVAGGWSTWGKSSGQRTDQIRNREVWRALRASGVLTRTLRRALGFSGRSRWWKLAVDWKNCTLTAAVVLRLLRRASRSVPSQSQRHPTASPVEATRLMRALHHAPAHVLKLCWRFLQPKSRESPHRRVWNFQGASSFCVSACTVALVAGSCLSKRRVVDRLKPRGLRQLAEHVGMDRGLLQVPVGHLVAAASWPDILAVQAAVRSTSRLHRLFLALPPDLCSELLTSVDPNRVATNFLEVAASLSTIDWSCPSLRAMLVRVASQFVQVTYRTSSKQCQSSLPSVRHSAFRLLWRLALDLRQQLILAHSGPGRPLLPTSAAFDLSCSWVELSDAVVSASQHPWD